VSVKTAPGVRYTVPQRIDVTDDTDNVKVYFRVSDVFRNKTEVVRSGDKVLLQKKKPKFAPGEMEYVVLTREMLDQAGESITVGLEDGGAN
ncbi:MAG: pyridine nucleotide-disulfide oxidoreductase, partial [Ruminococcus sp.]|nr:pyridine nucleotide-disulfide oxidoreductase [Candidatus Apopatosoma intestinale]